ncbi:MAG TPA: ferritin-like domain-containing protein [Candidatus Binatus sp.]|nr:ferritin-like domain-containing protein [Candidatus Binatus sp.]
MSVALKKESTILEDLNQALATETLAAYRYLYMSKIASGLSSLPISKLFEEMAEEEWGHAKLFMERIVQLGGVPLSRPAEWEKRSFHNYPELPRRGGDLKGMIRDALKLERAAVEFYSRLALRTRDIDIITHKLVIDALVDEKNEEQRLAALQEA